MNPMSAYHRCIFMFYRPFSHAVLMCMLLIAIIPNSSAQNEDTSKSDGFSFNPKLRLNPSMAIIFVCLLSAFFIMGCVSVSIRHCSLHHPADVFREDHALSPRPVLHCGLGSSIINCFPICQYSDVKELRLGKGVLECAVCLNEFSDEETLRLIPSCSHVFHPDCIDAWLASHVTCPVCRANLDQIHGNSTHPATRELSVPVPSQDLSVETDNLGIHIHIGSPLRLETKIVRSLSTGHVPVHPTKDCERFTLRLPEDVRTRLIKCELSRARSCVAFTRVRSSTKGFRRNNNGQGIRGSEEFGNSMLSSGSPEMEGISGEKSASLRNLLWPTRNFRVSLERLFSETRRKEEFEEEKSFRELMLHHSLV